MLALGTAAVVPPRHQQPPASCIGMVAVVPTGSGGESPCGALSMAPTRLGNCTPSSSCTLSLGFLNKTGFSAGAGELRKDRATSGSPPTPWQDRTAGGEPARREAPAGTRATQPAPWLRQRC